MKKLIQYINKYTPLDDEVINELANRIEFENYKKNELILKEGNRAHKVWFIKSGLIRKFYLHEGKEITSWIHAENEMLTSMHSYFHNKPSKEYIQAIEDTELISITRENSLSLSKYPQMELFSKELINIQFANIDEFTKKYNLMSAQEKYKTLTEVAPHIIQRAKLGYIASIMGVTQETLSRIRSKK